MPIYINNHICLRQFRSNKNLAVAVIYARNIERTIVRLSDKYVLLAEGERICQRKHL